MFLLFCLTFSTITFISLLITFIWFSSTLNPIKNRPPSPRKLPIIGNLHQLGSNPHRALQTITNKHGPLVLIHLGSVPVLVASSAETACAILKTHDLIFASRPKLSIPDTLTYGSKNIAFAPYGEHWRRVRSIAVLQLLSNKRVQSFRQVREQETHVIIDEIGKSCGSVIDLGELLNLLTNNVICRVALGRTYESKKFNDLLARFTYLIGCFSIGNYIPWLSWVDRVSGLEARTKKVAKEFDEFLEGVLEEHVYKKTMMDGEGNRNDKGQDLLDILLDLQIESNTSFMHREVIKAGIMDLFAAGTDVTSTSIEWAISELIRHPRVMKKLQKEVTEIALGKPMITEDDLEKMTYLHAVLKEALRLHTPAPLLISRESTQDVKLMGYDISAGTQVIINAWAIGRDPSQWEEPEMFCPERFLNNSIDYRGHNFEYIPFGAGRRGCPEEVKGEELDMTEITGLVLRRKSPLLVVATPHFD
ncbi:putative cytochrome P450 [Helianthus annuus]|nr:putative cytochrome P450 [Helianthus annuus]KAJ0617701.1 putative cytochrome P450 [Helianthus annuus]KAJ0776239.1 putative cytochrome P450 [Helianthus annuus]